jgi:WXG100 family type VII secretion target
MPDVQMDYEMMEDMAKTFKNGAEQLAETGRAMENLAGIMEGGGLLGEGGDRFADALRARLGPRLRKLHDKFAELSQDVMGALVDLRDGDKEAASRFKG